MVVGILILIISPGLEGSVCGVTVWNRSLTTDEFFDQYEVEQNKTAVEESQVKSLETHFNIEITTTESTISKKDVIPPEKVLVHWANFTHSGYGIVDDTFCEQDLSVIICQSIGLTRFSLLSLFCTRSARELWSEHWPDRSRGIRLGRLDPVASKFVILFLVIIGVIIGFAALFLCSEREIAIKRASKREEPGQSETYEVCLEVVRSCVCAAGLYYHNKNGLTDILACDGLRYRLFSRFLVLLAGAVLDVIMCEKMKTETDWTTAQHVTSPDRVEPTQAAAAVEQTTESPWLERSRGIRLGRLDPVASKFVILFLVIIGVIIGFAALFLCSEREIAIKRASKSRLKDNEDRISIDSTHSLL
eukprot:sb/3466003/